MRGALFGHGAARRHVLRIASLLTLMLAASCDPVSFPQGALNVANGILPMVPIPIGNSWLWTATAPDDNPAIAGALASNGLQVAWTNGGPSACDPLGVPPAAATFASCSQTYRTGSASGDRFQLQGNAPFPLGFAPTGDGSAPEAVFRQTYGNTAMAGIAALPNGIPEVPGSGCPNGNCQGLNFPVLFPKMHLPLDGTGQVGSLSLVLVRQLNSVATVTFRGSMLVLPTAGLIVVPVHVHLFTNQTNVEWRRGQTVNLGATYDDPGAVLSSFNSSTGQATAALVRPLNTDLDPGTSERTFFGCSVQLRLASVQFHPRPSSLLVNGQVVGNCRSCRQIDCPHLAADEPLANGRQFSPIGAQLQRFFANLPTGMPQGIHVIVVDRVEDLNGNYPGEGFGCRSDATGLVPSPIPFALVTLDALSLQIHEISHVLGLSETQIFQRLNAGFNQDDCNSAGGIRSNAATIVGLAP